MSLDIQKKSKILNLFCEYLQIPSTWYWDIFTFQSKLYGLVRIPVALSTDIYNMNLYSQNIEGDIYEALCSFATN